MITDMELIVPRLRQLIAGRSFASPASVSRPPSMGWERLSPLGWGRTADRECKARLLNRNHPASAGTESCNLRQALGCCIPLSIFSTRVWIFSISFDREISISPWRRVPGLSFPVSSLLTMRFWGEARDTRTRRPQLTTPEKIY